MSSIYRSKDSFFPIACNEAEAVLFRFFDPRRHPIEEWDILSNGNSVSQTFHSVNIDWPGVDPVNVTFRREVEIEVQDYDHLALCLQALDTTTVTIRARVDGRSRTIVDAVNGNNAGIELEGPISGRKISFLEIAIAAPGLGPGGVQIFFLGAFNRARREQIRNRRLPYPKDWVDLLLPEGDEPSEPEPQLGLFFGAEDLDRLRSRVAGATWRPVFEQLRALAHSFEDTAPWLGIGRTVNNFPVRNGHRGDGLNASHHWIDIAAMRVSAFVGLLDRDPALMRIALHHALALAHCEAWTTGFMSGMPGSSWDIRCFSEYRNAINAIFAWDWAGSLLTPAGKELLAQAVSIKALPWVQQTLMRHPYVRGNNQGIFFAFGGIVISIALGKHWPYGDDFIEPFRKALDQTVTTYYAADGGTYEGMGYATGSLEQVLAAYALYARHKGLPLGDIVPDVAIRSVDYITAMLSTEAPIGAVIKHSDGGRAGACVRPGALGLLCRLSSDPAVPALLAGMNLHPIDPNYTLEQELNIIWGPDELPEPAASPPTFRNLNKTGLLCSTRISTKGRVRVQFIGGPAGAGHGHDDRGSFVLEAFGEELAIDRGQMPYVDPRCATIKHARYHNLAIPHDENGIPMRQHNPCPVASTATGEGDETHLRCEMTLDGVWPDPVTGCSRELTGDIPEELCVIDRITASQAIQVGFYLQSRFPWKRSENGWQMEGKHARLTVTPEWETVSESGEEDFILGTKEPAYTLKLMSAPATSLEMNTRLVVAPA